MTGLSIAASGPAADAVARLAPRLAAAGAAGRLPQVGAAHRSRPLVGEVAAMRDDLLSRGLDEVVLVGEGYAGARRLLRLGEAGVTVGERSVVVVVEPHDLDVEGEELLQAVERSLEQRGHAIADHVVVVTYARSPLDFGARSAGYRIVNVSPRRERRPGALSAFGVLPDGLAGTDIEALLDDADAVGDLLAENDEDNPALRLAAALGGLPDDVDLRFVDTAPTPAGHDGLAAWVARTVGRGVAGPAPTADHGELLVLIGADLPDELDDLAHPSDERVVLRVDGSLGAQLLLWETTSEILHDRLVPSPHPAATRPSHPATRPSHPATRHTEGHA